MLWHQVYEISCRVARRFRLSFADSEEIGQEMLLRALRQTQRASINVAWIYRGAYFACIDRIRAHRAEEQALSRYANGRRPTELFSSARISPADLRVALQQLPADCQQLIYRYYWEGMTWAELDHALGRGRRCAQYETKKCVRRLAAALRKYAMADD